MVNSWSQYLSSSHETFTQVLSQLLHKIEDAEIHFEKLSNKNSKFLLLLFENGRVTSWINHIMGQKKS